MEFDYKRKKGQQFVYHMNLSLIPKDGGGFTYSASVYRDDDYLGKMDRWPLHSGDREAAEKEARNFIEADIEDLVGIRE